MAIAVSPSDHRKAVSKALACRGTAAVVGDQLRGDDHAEDGGSDEPPTCCMIRVALLAWGTWAALNTTVRGIVSGMAANKRTGAGEGRLSAWHAATASWDLAVRHARMDHPPTVYVREDRRPSRGSTPG